MDLGDWEQAGVGAGLRPRSLAAHRPAPGRSVQLPTLFYEPRVDQTPPEGSSWAIMLDS